MRLSRHISRLPILLTIAISLACASGARAVSPLAASGPTLPSWADPENLTYAALDRGSILRTLPAPHLEQLEQMIEEPVAEGSFTPTQEETAAMVSDLLGYAKGFMGTRYRRGGKAPKSGFDCSGFTSYIYGQFGYSLSPSSSGQYAQGRHVSRDEVEPGDLLFFKGRSSHSKRVGHVGIALSQDPETGVVTFIHAATSGGIRIDRTSAPYYKARYLGARRVVE